MENKKSMLFAVPMKWREPTNYPIDCYFCLTKIFGYSKHTKSRIVYPDCLSVLRFVTHSHENIPIPTPRPVSERDNDSSSAESIDISQTSNSSASIAAMLSDKMPHSSQAADIPQLMNQNDLNALVRDLVLTKEKSELLFSRLKQWNMLQKES